MYRTWASAPLDGVGGPRNAAAKIDGRVGEIFAHMATTTDGDTWVSVRHPIATPKADET